VHGIGVFAITDIPEGCTDMFSKGIGEYMKVSRKEIDALPDHSKTLVEEYCLFDEEHYWVPNIGFKVIDLVSFLNHSDTPNIVSVNDGEQFRTIRPIKAGEELFVDYGTLVDESLADE
jgi:SET domain-containing protein